MNVQRNREEPSAAVRALPHRNGWVALRITLIYLVISIVYIIFSDRLIGLLADTPERFTAMSSAKGVLFVVFTSVMLYAMVRGALRREIALRTDLDHSLQEAEQARDTLAEQAQLLQERQQWFAAIFERVTVPFLLFAQGGGHLVQCNPAALKFFGAQGETQLKGMRLTDLLPEAAVNGMLHDSRTGRDASPAAPYHSRFEWTRPNGERIVARITLSTVVLDGEERCFAVCRDITESVRAQQMIAHSEEQLRVTMNAIGDGVISTDEQGRVVMLNAVAEQLCGWSARQAVGMPLKDVLCLRHLQDDGRAEDPAMEVLFAGRIHRGRYRQQTRGGDSRQVNCVVSPILGEGNSARGVVVVFRDISEQMQREAEILYLSYHDTLTGLYNRAFFEEETKRLDTVRQLPLALIIGDANNLKLVNDVFGHVEGDRMIVQLASVFRACCRQEDIICRWGGDEFTMLLPGTGAEEARRICRRIQNACDALPPAEGSSVRASVSLGWAVKTDRDQTMDEVLRDAETMMYANKLREGQDSFQALLLSLRGRMDASLQEGSPHTRGIEELGLRICRELALDESTQQQFRQLTRLHDIGNITMGDDILNRPDILTEQEWEQVRKHPIVGYRIARSSPELAGVADAILCHHERWDGAGYPRGLREQEIPLLSRIFAVADAYDVMTRGRPWQPAVPAETALETLFAHSGQQFDPEIVRVFATVSHDFQEAIG